MRARLKFGLIALLVVSCSTPPTPAVPAASAPLLSPSPRPTPAETAPPAVSPMPSASVCAVTPCPPALPIQLNEFAEMSVASPVWAAPGEGEPVDIGLSAGFGVLVTETFAGDKMDWYRIQIPLPMSPTNEWVYAWLPATVAGGPMLVAHEPMTPALSMNAPCPDDVQNGWLLIGGGPPRRLACVLDSRITLEGFLGRVPHPEAPIFSGTPEWLANEPQLILWSAVGTAVTGLQIPLHIDPDSGVSVEPGLLSDRDGVVARPVHVTGHFADPAAASCSRSARLPGFLPMSEMEQELWCLQQFVVDQVHAGDWIEPDLEVLDTCHNPDAGYGVSFPAAWYTNTEYGGGMAACQFFNPGSFVVTSGRPAQGVAISLSYVPEGSGIGRFSGPLWSEEVTIAGRHAVRSEWAGTGEGGVSTPWVRRYEYVITLDEDGELGPYLWASTTNGHAGDYETNKQVLDVMMRSLELPDP